MRVFVTGGNGFIGSVVVKDLLDAGHSVVCLLRAGSNTDRLRGLEFDSALGDVREARTLREGMRGCDATIHLAAPSSWDGDRAPMVGEVIEGGTRNVLEVAARLPDHRVVMVSSTAAINASDRPRVFDEHAAFAVRDPTLRYAHAKHRAEMRVREAYERGLPVVIVNPAEVYGPGDTALNTASNLIDFATSSPVLACNGGTSVVHVDDVSSGIIAALLHGRPGERYILGGDNLTIRELAELCLDLVGRKVRVWVVPNRVVRPVSRIAAALRLPLPYNAHVVPYATRYWFVDNRKAQRELGVSFRNARETIAPTIDWLRGTGRL